MSTAATVGNKSWLGWGTISMSRKSRRICRGYTNLRTYIVIFNYFTNRPYLSLGRIVVLRVTMVLIFLGAENVTASESLKCCRFLFMPFLSLSTRCASMH